MALTQKQIQSLAPKEKRQQFGCGDGLNIIVEPAHKGGGKSFEGRYRMKVDGRTMQIPVRIGVFGTKPGQHSLREALTRWNEIKYWAKKENQDPRQFGKDEPETSSLTLRDAINAFLKSKSHLKEHTLRNYRLQFDNQVLSAIDGSTSMVAMQWDNGGRQKVMDMKKKIEERGSFDQANRVQKVLSQCFDHAIDQGWMKRGQNPAAKQSKDLVPKHERHHPTIPWSEVKKLLEEINLNKYSAHNLVVLSVKFMLMTFLRAGALVRLEWDWIDENEGIIVIPGNTPGLKRTFKTQHLPHHIPITHEMKQMLDAARKLDFSEKYVFGSYRQGKYPHLNPEAPNKFLSNLGYKNVLTAHGWRSVPLTVGQEQLKVSHEIIQRQMGHLVGDKVRKAYDNSLMLEERRNFLERWSQLLVAEGLKV
jgi:integrase